MIIDRYTKTVLTIIASVLMWIAVQNSIGPAHASKEIAKVAICDVNSNSCAEVGASLSLHVRDTR
jgi:hypothetical protein